VPQAALESEPNTERSKTSGPNRNESSSRTFFCLGGRYDFCPCAGGARSAQHHAMRHLHEPQRTGGYGGITLSQQFGPAKVRVAVFGEIRQRSA